MDRTEMPTRSCPSCGATADGRFCSECGASLIGVERDAVTALRADAVEAIGFDRRVFATLRDLLVHPVRIVRACMAGDIRGYLPPLKLFLALGGTYMLLLSIVQPYAFDPASWRAAGLGDGAIQLIEARIRERGLSRELFAERMQSRMNTVAPVVTALALLPMVGVLKTFERRRRWAEHALFMLAASNGVWLVSLLLLPVALLSTRLHQLVLVLVPYVYIAIVFFPLYRSRSHAVTAGRFAIFIVVDLAMTAMLALLLFVLVYRSVLAF